MGRRSKSAIKLPISSDEEILCSERLRHKRSKKEFRMPTREDVWDDIQDVSIPGKSYRYLQPRNVVQPLSKV